MGQFSHKTQGIQPQTGWHGNCDRHSMAQTTTPKHTPGTLEDLLNAAKAESEKLDAARQALPDNAADADVDAANKSYFAALQRQAVAQIAYNKSISTPAQLAAQAEQMQAEQAQLAAHLSLAKKDKIAPGIAKTQAQLDAEYDAELRKNQD